MNDTKHTPGPWKVISDYANLKDQADVWTNDPPGSAMIAECRGPDKRANARLIASAPDLLAALAGCADALSEAGKSFALNNRHAIRPNLFELHEQVARAAIAKVKG